LGDPGQGGKVAFIHQEGKDNRRDNLVPGRQRRPENVGPPFSRRNLALSIKPDSQGCASTMAGEARASLMSVA
jgi:hypothetical protein